MIFFRDTESIIGLVIFILCVLYSSIRTASNSQAAKLSGSDKILLKDVGEGGNSDPEANKVWDNEEDEVAYSWSLFHAMFALATVNSTYKLTNKKKKKILSSFSLALHNDDFDPMGKSRLGSSIDVVQQCRCLGQNRVFVVVCRTLHLDSCSSDHSHRPRFWLINDDVLVNISKKESIIC